MTRKAIILCILVGTLWGATCLGHGVSRTVFEGAVGIEVTYDDGTPMCYCEVKVFSPLDNETEFQQGSTDKNGRFTFFPDSAGTWHVTVDDGMGHALSENIEIKKGMKVVKDNGRKFSRFHGAIIGVSIIFGIFGVSSCFLPWKRPKR